MKSELRMLVMHLVWKFILVFVIWPIVGVGGWDGNADVIIEYVIREGLKKTSNILRNPQEPPLQ